jgi:hypothetical protein
MINYEPDDYHLLGDDAVWLSQKMIIIIVTAVETSNLTNYEPVSIHLTECV